MKTDEDLIAELRERYATESITNLKKKIEIQGGVIDALHQISTRLKRPAAILRVIQLAANQYPIILQQYEELMVSLTLLEPEWLKLVDDLVNHGSIDHMVDKE